MKERSERSAVDAIHRLRDLDGVSDGPLRSWILFAAGLALGAASPSPATAQTLPPGHPPVAAPTPATPTPTGAIRIHAVHIGADGVRTPLEGARAVVQLQRRRPGPQTVFDTISSEVVPLDSLGRGFLRGKGPPAGGRAQVSLAYGGGLFTGIPDAEGQVTLEVYDLSEKIDGLSASVHLGVQVDESRIWIQTDVTLVNSSGHAIDLSRADTPFVLPLVSPVVGGKVLTRGWMPHQARRHMSMETQPDRGRLELEDGAWIYRGLVLPGETTRVKMRFPFDITGDQMTLGLLSERIPIDGFFVSLQYGNRISPTVLFSRASAGWGESETGGASRIAWLLEPVPAGEALYMKLARLPAPSPMLFRGVVVLIVFAGFILIVAFLRARAFEAPVRVGRHGA